MKINRHRILFWLALLPAIISALPSPGETVSIAPDADAYISSSFTDQNFGDQTTVVSGLLGVNSGRELRRTFLRFNLDGVVPQGAVIESASLTLTVTRAPQAGRADSVFDLRRMLKPWTEGQVTWTSASGSVSWEIAGASGASDASQTASSSALIQAEATCTFATTTALVADVQAWTDSPQNNFGWLLISEDEQTPETARHFGAREDPLNAALLQITYSLPSLSVEIEPSSQTVVTGSSVSFHAIASGAPPLVYQWYFNGVLLPDATAAELTLESVQTNQSGLYTVALSTASGSITSAPATLAVSQPEPGLPSVNIDSPTNGSKLAVNARIPIRASAVETNGTIVRVDFLLGSNVVGTVTAPPFQVLLANVTPGNYLLSARATDDRGLSAASPSVSFSVLNPPATILSSPLPNARLPLGTNATVSATVSSSARIARVDFFAVQLDASSSPLQTNLVASLSTQPFTTAWTPAATGDYLISAAAVDELGQTGVSALVSARVFLPELQPPRIAITDSPENFAIVKASPAAVRGVASDNVGLDHVEFQVFSGPFLQTRGPVLQASGSTNWMAEAPLAPGKNAVQFRAVDLAGNKSPVLTRYLTFLIRAPLTIVASDGGAASPNLDGRLLILGRSYTVIAKPRNGFVFAGWTNARGSLNPRLTFIMESNLVLQAQFVPNPFLAVAGEYGGLFFDADTNRFRPEASGAFSLQLARGGAFSGRIKTLGTTSRFHGHFDPAGNATVPIPRRGGPPLAISLQAGLTNQPNAIIGIVTAQGDGVALRSELLAARKAPQSGGGASGIVSLKLDLTEESSDANPITGTAFVAIHPGGGVNVSGGFGGSHFAFTSIISESGEMPFYVLLDHSQTLLIGWLMLASNGAEFSGGELFEFSSR
ncbi:MAG TPA: Ig-like domain-containing protein, partial [Verrucomicrobiae bacterium]|nr:Ig-like domain-containing protein [Verrucomicrobiae bacterium]